MSSVEVFWRLAPIVALLTFVVFAITRNAGSKPHGLNKRDSAPRDFGGPWTDYTFHPDGYHPDDDPAPKGQKTKKPRRKNKRRQR